MVETLDTNHNMSGRPHKVYDYLEWYRQPDKPAVEAEMVMDRTVEITGVPYGGQTDGHTIEPGQGRVTESFWTEGQV